MASIILFFEKKTSGCEGMETTFLYSLVSLLMLYTFSFSKLQSYKECRYFIRKHDEDKQPVSDKISAPSFAYRPCFIV